MLKRKFNYLLLILVMITSCVVPLSTVHAVIQSSEKSMQEPGIKYENNDLGFSLTLPESWRDKYNVEVRDKTNVAFRVKLHRTYDDERYNNIFLFTIHVGDENLEKEGGEDFLIGTNNGKAYSVSVDYALQHYDRYEEMFPEATEGERRMIATMTKQITDILKSFKMLDKKANGRWEAPKRFTKNLLYDFEAIRTTKIGKEEVVFSIIKTPIDNIRTEVIKKPVSATNYIGINGGFNDQSNGTVEPRSISYYNPAMVTDGSTEVSNFNSTSNPERFPNTIASRSTFVTYYDKNEKRTKATIIPAASLDDVFKQFAPHQEVINAIGGKGYDINHFRGSKKDYSQTPLRRTILAYKEENGTVYAYLIITQSFVTVERLKLHVEKLGFKENENIMLDASGSTSMRAKIKKFNGKWEWYVDKGSEGIGLFSYFLVYLVGYFFDTDTKNPADRKVYNMIRLIDEPKS
ncbi:hypothetical protein KFD70_28450 [Bacillus pfraonensis]|uniref:hypothetical protein n=1 Tax=Bacillus TaxID=1386 RepID=UPI00301315F9